MHDELRKFRMRKIDIELDKEHTEQQRRNENYKEIFTALCFCLILSTRPFPLFILYCFIVHSRKENVL
jgi:hypothetical protein